MTAAAMLGADCWRWGTREEDGAGIQEERVPWARISEQVYNLFWTLSL